MESLIKDMCLICMNSCEGYKSYKEIKIGEVSLIEIMTKFLHGINWSQFQTTKETPDKVCTKCFYKLFDFHNLNQTFIRSQSQISSFTDYSQGCSRY
jgi:hypothetical protein